MFEYEATIHLQEALIESARQDIIGGMGEVPEGTTITLTREFGNVDSSNPTHACMYGTVQIDHPDAVTLAEIGACLGN